MAGYRISGADGNFQPIQADAVEFSDGWLALYRRDADGVLELVIAVRADEVSSVVNVNNDPW